MRENNLENSLVNAAKVGNVYEVNTLLTQGADVNATDNDGKTGLYYARSKPDIVKLLKKPLQKIIYPTVMLASLGAIVTAAVLLTPGWPMALAVCASVFAWMASEYSHDDKFGFAFTTNALGLT